MAEVTRYMYPHKEVVAALLKEQGIHEGIWSLSIEFTLGATMGGPTPDTIMPTALVGINRIGLEKVDAINNNLTFDAALLNPLKSEKPATKTARTKAK